jgi:hypothetical protein
MSEIVIVVTGQTGPSGGGGGSTALDDLTDVTITAAASGDILRHNGTAWVDTPGTTHFEVAGAVAAHEADASAAHAASAISFSPTGSIAATDVQAAIAEVATDVAAAYVTQATADASYQPLDSQLTALSGVTSAADALPYFTGATTAGTTTLTSFARTLLDDANQAAAQATLGVVPGTNVQAYDAELAAIAGLTSAADRLPYFTGSGTAALATFTSAGRALVDDADAAAQRTTLGLGNLATATTINEYIGIAVSDETTAITTGNAKVTFRMPFAMTLTAVRANLNTASSSGTPTVDINEGGVSILSTKLTIDANELTSTTAASAAVISDSALADDAEITIDIDTAGTGAKGLKVWLIGTRAV